MGITKFLVPPNLIHLCPVRNHQPEDGKDDKQCNLGIRDFASTSSLSRDVNIDSSAFIGDTPVGCLIDEPNISSLSRIIESDLTTCRESMLEFTFLVMLGW